MITLNSTLEEFKQALNGVNENCELSFSFIDKAKDMKDLFQNLVLNSEEWHRSFGVSLLIRYPNIVDDEIKYFVVKRLSSDLPQVKRMILMKIENNNIFLADNLKEMLK